MSGYGPLLMAAGNRTARIASNVWRASLVLLVFSVFVPARAYAADLDCSDFGTKEAANKELDRTISEYGRDTNGLDADGDGEACERNGSALMWTGIGAALGTLLGFGLSKSNADGADDWAGAFGHATAAGFAGLFLGWLLPGIMPRQWTVTAFAIGAGLIAAVAEYNIVSRSRAAG